MEIVETLADKLAKEALEAIEKTGDQKLVDEMSEVIGASSPTLQEAFLTAVRIRRAEKKARDLLTKFKEHGRKSAKSEPAQSSQSAVPAASKTNPQTAL